MNNIRPPESGHAHWPASRSHLASTRKGPQNCGSCSSGRPEKNDAPAIMWEELLGAHKEQEHTKMCGGGRSTGRKYSSAHVYQFVVWSGLQLLGRYRLRSDGPVLIINGVDLFMRLKDLIYPVIEDFHHSQRCSELQHPL